MDDAKKCAACGSTLAANGHCPDCRGPKEEPEWLDGYGYRKDEPRAVTNGEPTSDASKRTKEAETCRVLPFPMPGPVPMTPEKLYAAGDGHHVLTPARAAQVAQTIKEVSRELERERRQMRVVKGPARGGD